MSAEAMAVEIATENTHVCVGAYPKPPSRSPFRVTAFYDGDGNREVEYEESDDDDEPEIQQSEFDHDFDIYILSNKFRKNTSSRLAFFVT